MKTSNKSQYPSSLIGKFAITALALGVSSQFATASITFDIRATSKTISGITTNNLGGGISTFGGGVNNVTGLDIGDKVVFTLFAYVTGTNAEDGGNNGGSTNEQGFQSVWGSAVLQPGGGAYGAVTSVTNSGLGAPGIGGMNLGGAARYGGSGGQAGKIQDLNANSFVDIGSNGTSTSDLDLVFARANSMITTNGGFGVQTPIDGLGTTTQFNVASFTLTISSATSATPTLVQWRNPSSFSGGPIALWQENSLPKSNNTGGVINIGPGTTIVAVPEPSAFGMVLIGALGLVGFRRLGFRRTA